MSFNYALFTCYCSPLTHLFVEVRFSERFQKKANFPKKPEILSDVPQHRSEFIPGRDQLLEDLIISERKEEEEDECDSLTVVEAGIVDIVDTEDEEEEEEEEEQLPPTPQAWTKMPPSKTKLPVVKVPFKQPGQCEVSWEMLKPVIGYVSVKDPTMSRRKAYLSRTGLIVRVDVPAGLVLGSFDPEVSADGKQLVFTGFMDRSRYDPHHVLGDILCQSDELIMGVEKGLTKQWTFVKNKCEKTSEGAEIRDYKRYAIILPEPVERDFRNPLRGWDLNKIGVKGCLNKCPATRDTFYYLFLFTEESKNATPARASTNNLMYMDETVTMLGLDSRLEI